LRLLFIVLTWLGVRVVMVVVLERSQLRAWSRNRPIVYRSCLPAMLDIVLSMDAVLLLFLWMLLLLFSILLLLVLHLRVEDGLLPPPLS